MGLCQQFCRLSDDDKFLSLYTGSLGYNYFAISLAVILSEKQFTYICEPHRFIWIISTECYSTKRTGLSMVDFSYRCLCLYRPSCFIGVMWLWGNGHRTDESFAFAHNMRCGLLIVLLVIYRIKHGCFQMQLSELVENRGHPPKDKPGSIGHGTLVWQKFCHDTSYPNCSFVCMIKLRLIKVNCCKTECRKSLNALNAYCVQ